MSGHVLFVCTGNICRSPLAERLLTSRLGPSGLRISSAGTHALEGHPMDAAAAFVLRELGGDPDGHVARPVTPALVADADLILTADTRNRGEVLRAEPAALRRTFTLREFARLAGATDVGPGRLDERIAEIARRRGSAPPPAPGDDDIADPFGAPLPVMRDCGRRISDALDGVVVALGPVG
jgi:protein-tyrosine phosphatase